MNFRLQRGTARAALRRAAVAVLTLYVFNIYPRCCFADGTNIPSGNLSIDALFDFEVPVDVVQAGVSNGIGDLLPDSWEDTMEGIMERNGWNNGFEELSESEWGVSTNGFLSFGLSDGPRVFVDSDFLDGIDDTFLALALSTNVYSPGNSASIGSLPSISSNVDLLTGVFAYFSEDAPPADPLGLPDSPLVSDSDTLFADSFWVSQLSMQSLVNFDGGHLDSVLRSLPQDGVFAWVVPFWVGTLDEVIFFVHDHPNGVRPYVRFVAVILYWVALYRFFIKRVVFTVQACFEGTK